MEKHLYVEKKSIHIIGGVISGMEKHLNVEKKHIHIPRIAMQTMMIRQSVPNMVQILILHGLKIHIIQQTGLLTEKIIRIR